VIADNATAAWRVASEPDFASGAAPTVVTSGARKDGSITGTVSENIADAGCVLA